MAIFKYVAKDGEGKKVSGTLTAKDEGIAIGDLRKKNLTVVSINETGAKKRGGGVSFRGRKRAARPRIKGEALVIFTRQLSTMISAGIPLLEALEILVEQAQAPGQKVCLDRVVESVRAGTDLSEALGQFPKVFSSIYVNMVKAGEASGQLDDILVRLAEYMESNAALKREIKSAMTYPAISMFLISIITVGLMVGIVPKFKEIFDSMKVELPGITKALLFVSTTMQRYFLVAIGGLIVMIVAFICYIKTDRGQWQWHWVLLRVPIFGALFRKVAISRFARTFATLIQSGVPILGALEIVAATAGNRIVEDAVQSSRENVRQGETLAEPLGESGVFPPMVTRMIGIGERSGALEQLLEKISEFYDQQVKATIAALTSLIEPLLIGLMGTIVGGIVLAIFLPIFKLQETLAGG